MKETDAVCDEAIEFQNKLKSLCDKDYNQKLQNSIMETMKAKSEQEQLQEKYDLTKKQNNQLRESLTCFKTEQEKDMKQF